MVKAFFRIFLVLAVLVAIVFAALYFGRFQLAEMAIIRQLEERGFENVSLKVTRLEQDGITLSSLSAGPSPGNPALSIDELAVTTDLNSLLAGEIGELVLSDASVEIRQTGDDWLIAGVPLSQLRGTPSADGSSTVVLEKIRLASVAASIETEGGSADLLLDGTYDLAKGGRFQGEVSSDRIDYGPAEAQNISVRLAVDLSQAGAFQGSLSATSDIATATEQFPGITLNADFDGTSWQSFIVDPQGAAVNAEISFSAPALPLGRLEQIQPTLNFFVAGPPAKTAGFRIVTSLAYENGVLRLTERRDGAASFATLTLDNGVTAELTEQAGEDILVRGDGRMAVKFGYAVNGIKAAPANGVISLLSEDSLPVQLKSTMVASTWRDENFELVPGEIAFDGTINGPRVSGRVTFQGGASYIETDNSVLQDFLTSGVFYVTTDFAARTLKVTTPDGCIDLAAPRITTGAGNFRLQDARFCAPALAPVILDASRRREEGVRARASGVLRARTVRADIGETRISGIPPAAAIRINYADDRLTATADLQGSSLNFDNRLSFSGAAASGTAVYEQGDISFDGDITRLMIEDLTEPVVFSPLSFTGGLQLEDTDASFRGELFTPEGDPLAAAEGEYDLRAGKGAAQLNFGPLVFSPGGLQPASIAPALKGFFENSIGEAGGVVILDWAENDVRTSGTFDVKDLTFNGPVRQVTLTDQLNGTISFSQLLPLKTDGVQEASVKLLDLDALVLTDGKAEYEFPGDNTVRIRSAKWPWFSGELEIVDALIPLDRSKVTVPLKIRNIDLSELLSFLDVDGLSGTGRLEGDLPVIFEDGKARIDNGRLVALGAGTLRYESDSVDAAAEAAGEAGRIAFEALTDYRFTDLELTINGDLSGDVDFALKMNGRTDSEIASRGLIYNINIRAPLFGLIEQFRANQRGEDYILQELSEKAGVELIFEKPEINRGEAPDTGE